MFPGGQHRAGKLAPARSGSRGCDLAEQLPREVERNAAVSDAVLVIALEALAVVPEQQRSGMQARAAAVRPVGESPLRDGRDRVTVMAFLERPIAGARGANDFADGPVRAAGDRPDAQPIVSALVACNTIGESLLAIAGQIAIFPKL